MTPRGVCAVMWKEVREADRTALLCGLLAALFWGSLGAVGPLSKMPSVLKEYVESGRHVDTFVAYVPLVLMLLVGNPLTVRTFNGEKSQRTIESLLCSPLSLEDIWLGKTLAISCMCYLVSIAVAATYIIISAAILHAPLPSPLSLFHFLLVSPLLAFSVIGVWGYLYLMLGKPTFAYLASLVAVLAVFALVFSAVQKISISWRSSLFLSAISGATAICTMYCTRFLSKERIILTIQ